jgi:hypothetical protein
MQENDFTFRWLEYGDYDMLCEWWKFWRWPQLDKDFLPDYGRGGILVLKGDVPICSIFLYFSNSDVCFLGWLVSSPTYREKDRYKAIAYLIDVASEEAFKQGRKYIYGVSNKQSVIERYVKSGFIPGPSNCTEMIKHNPKI